jgi:hydroxymethylpyrimidine pyrophosphatase-like HAD family hydrolase
MIALDSDGTLLSHNGQTASRDIVQFVDFKKVSKNGTDALAKEVLAEIPRQVLEHYEQI